MKAVCLVRDPPHYRRDAILAGLKMAGFDVVPNINDPQPGDLVVIWNRYGRGQQLADRFEAAGAAVIVVENGYLGHRYSPTAKPFTAAGQQLFAMALWHHNGAGAWPIGEPGRWREQGIEVQPWRKDGEHVLVLPQRGIGPVGVGMPREWPEKAARRLRNATERPVKVRAHPGNAPAQKPLEADLEGAWCAVTWGSGAALKAIVAGVPVFHDFGAWIGGPAARRFAAELIDHPCRMPGAQEAMLDRLAWAQWDCAEIATGEPFERLMGLYGARKRAA